MLSEKTNRSIHLGRAGPLDLLDTSSLGDSDGSTGVLGGSVLLESRVLSLPELKKTNQSPKERKNRRLTDPTGRRKLLLLDATWNWPVAPPWLMLTLFSELAAVTVCFSVASWSWLIYGRRGSQNE